MSWYLGLIARATKSNALEQPAKDTSDRLTERVLSRAWWSNEASRVLNDIMK